MRMPEDNRTVDLEEYLSWQAEQRHNEIIKREKSMKQRRFVISDLHLGHEKVYEVDENYSTGVPFRHWADNSIDGDDYIVKQWNSVVTPDDKVYVLGDVAFPKNRLHRFSEMNGTKILVAGNHDLHKTKDYLLYFKSIRGASPYTSKSGVEIIMTHIPVHPDELELNGRWDANIHGHTHKRDIDDKRYINVCVEKLDCIPKSLDDLVDDIACRKMRGEW